MVIRVYYPESRTLSIAMRRIRRGLIKYKPKDVEIVNNPRNADVHILDYVGQHPKIQDKKIMSDIPSIPMCKKYIIIYHCHPAVPCSFEKELSELLKNALLVITHTRYLTFYDPIYSPFPNINFDKINWFVTPWGFDPDIFYPSNPPLPKLIDVLTFGLVDESEKLSDILKACKLSKKMLLHLCGYSCNSININDYERYVKCGYVNDDTLRFFYWISKYTCAFRMHIGFELPILEALACGSTPIVLDFPCYREHFKDIAIFISPDRIVDELVKVLNMGKVLHVSFDFVRKRFSWEYIAPNIWEKIIESIK